MSSKAVVLKPPPGLPPGGSRGTPGRKASAEDSRNLRVADRDPQMGVCDVTQLLSLSEESVMQNTMVIALGLGLGLWLGSTRCV